MLYYNGIRRVSYIYTIELEQSNTRFYKQGITILFSDRANLAGRTLYARIQLVSDTHVLCIIALAVRVGRNE